MGGLETSKIRTQEALGRILFPENVLTGRVPERHTVTNDVVTLAVVSADL